MLTIGIVISAAAAPFLCCDPMTAEVTQIDVNLNGQLIQVAAADIMKGASEWCLVDLGSIVEGPYTANAVAHYGVWGTSKPSADFLFVKPAINGVVNIKLNPAAPVP